jgi:hypothetical protein
VLTVDNSALFPFSYDVFLTSPLRLMLGRGARWREVEAHLPNCLLKFSKTKHLAFTGRKLSYLKLLAGK